MIPFKAPLNDILFCLEHIAQAADVAGWDAQQAKEIGDYFAEFAENELAPINSLGDAQGCKLVDGKVHMPAEFVQTYQMHAELGWQGLIAPEKLGGQGLSTLILAMTSEIFSGANHSLQMVTALVHGAMQTLLSVGSSAQQNQYIPFMASGACLATMCLTEPQAGSDLAKIQCKAERTEAGWLLSGEKCFISGGHQNMSDGILHFVLARTGSHGIRGLSLFLCPLIDSTVNDSGVNISRLESKMGLHASPTCQIEFRQAKAELVGIEGEGLKAMFHLMTFARLDVALQGVAHAARAHQISRTYASERSQGKTAEGAAAFLSYHADIQRQITHIDALALGSRALALFAQVVSEKQQNELADILTPITKVVASNAGMEAAAMGMQVLGGYGYLNDYGLEQVYRDVRVTSIYEGANGIHERNIVLRLLSGASGDAFEESIHEFIASAVENTPPHIAVGLKQWQHFRTQIAGKPENLGIANAFTVYSAELLLSCLWCRHQVFADAHNEPERIKSVAEYGLLQAEARMLAAGHIIERSIGENTV